MPILPKIFIAYAREDTPLLEKLRKPLNVLRRNGHCDIFFDGEIVPGERWDERLKNELHQADIYLLLVTDDFLDSDYINDVELPKALEKEKSGKAKVVPIILRPCMWQYTLLKEFQVVLYEGKPIEPSGGYVHAVEQVARIIEGRNETSDRNGSLWAPPRRSPPESRGRGPPQKQEAEAAAKRKQDADEEAERQRRRSLDPFHDLMVPIKGGSFKMGGTHPVTIKDFHLGKHPVTQAQWRAIMGSDPQQLRFKGCDDCPVERVSWGDVQNFVKKMNEKTGEIYRLPSETEWEFAARGGMKSKNYKYAGSDNVDEVAWHMYNSGHKNAACQTVKSQ
ncbi:MAG: SUMF1/EgtB/PvdO family nonheme iron enzyme [Saprospiraceae bacterium]|nr:SUMF1/EgtB/PvdO family nonheme iron enzyme [Saprospiraceae bacterium]